MPPRPLSRRQLVVGAGALAAAAALPRVSRAATIVKLATMAPENSSWHKGLMKMATEWKTITGGAVEVKIYAGGVAGNETVMVRKMRIGQLHAAALTNMGILDIDPAPQVTQTPMLIKDYAELDYVMNKLSPEFESRLLAKGFVTLNWGDAGWVRFFSKTPMRTPEDIGKFKMYAWEGDPAAVEVFRQAGFKPVVVASSDMLPSLQSGLVDAFPSSPLAALALQWFALAPNMLDVPWAPMVGGTVMTKALWDQIPANHHAALLASAKRVGQELKTDVRSQDTKAVSVMQRYGLTVHTVDAATKARWEALARSTYANIRGKMVPTDIFDKAKAAADEYR